VINEVDYDQVGTDTAEFAEIYNPTGFAADLSGIAVAFINGANNAEYGRVNLSGTLAPGAYLICASPAVTPPAGTLTFPLPLSTNFIQNGSPDGIALIDVPSSSLIDALSYEGAILFASINGFPGPVSLVEGTALASSIADSNTVPGALVRLPNGSDTNDAAADWKFSSTPTPGAANVP
jgi:hypothetical protein